MVPWTYRSLNRVLPVPISIALCTLGVIRVDTFNVEAVKSPCTVADEAVKAPCTVADEAVNAPCTVAEEAVKSPCTVAEEASMAPDTSKATPGLLFKMPTRPFTNKFPETLLAIPRKESRAAKLAVGMVLLMILPLALVTITRSAV
jgi:hypothetical protein